MSTLHEFDYLFAFGTIFALLDAFNIGANDVANSFATSVSSKSLTLRQAVLAACVFEFLGAMTAGSRVASTIKNNIIDVEAFNGNAGVQLLAFTCAITASASWLMTATRNSWPVSTTYSIVSSLAGVGVAVGGAEAVTWGWGGGKGLGAIFAGFVIAPGISAGFAAVLFLFTKFGVLLRSNSVRAALIASPIYFFTMACVLTMTIIYKGSPELDLDDLPESTLAAAIPGTGAVIAALSAIFWLPYVYAKAVRNDYTVRWYHFFIGPYLWFKQAPADAEQAGAQSAVPDYAIRKRNHLDDDSAEEPKGQSSQDDDSERGEKGASATNPAEGAAQSNLAQDVEGSYFTPLKEGFWWQPANLWILFRYRIIETIMYGTTVDVRSMQRAGSGDKSSARIARMHERATQYDNKTEHLYSFLQVMTACTASFAHGANDLANAIGPWSGIYSTWSRGQIVEAKNQTPVWLIAVGAIMLCIGLATYGYNIMRVLGNKMTLMSPSRGFCMELGAAITVLLASQYGIPVSTTMCITGATLGVAICNGDLRAYNWRGFAWIFAGWVITVPVAGTAAGCLMGILLNSPHF